MGEGPVVPSVGTLEVIWNFQLTLREGECSCRLLRFFVETLLLILSSPIHLGLHICRNVLSQLIHRNASIWGHTALLGLGIHMVDAKEWTNVGFVYILVMIQYWCMPPFFDLTSITLVFYGLITRAVFFWRKFLWSIFRKSDIVCTILEIQRTH